MFYKLLLLSRPRFWIYLIGPYLVWSVSARSLDMTISPDVWWLWSVWLIYFIRPANLLIYGVNDLSDGDTDAHNPKKGWYEQRVSGSEYSFYVKLSIFKRNIPFVLAWFSLLSRHQLIVFFIFLWLGIWYSLAPVRFKARPFLDAISNILYIMPWLMWYLIAWWTSIDWMVVAWACLRAMAMHAYSAVPDISADCQAWLQTIATVCGHTGTLLLCRAWYVGAAVLAWHAIGWYSIWGWLIYSSMMIWSLQSHSVFAVYRRFPIVNMVVGFGLFWWVVGMKI